MQAEIIFETQKGPFWDWKVALDLFLGGAGVGVLLFGVALDAGFKGRYRRIGQTAALLAPALIALGLVFLLLKLGRPAALYMTFTHFAPTSPLWWGGIFQTLLIVGALVWAWQWRDSLQDRRARRVLGITLAPLALVVGVYHGLLLGVIHARPLWNTGPTVVAALLTFVSTGIAAVMLVHLARMRIAGRLVEGERLNAFLDDMKPVRNTLVAALFLQLGTYALWWLALRFGSLQDAQALAMANAVHGPVFWWAGVVVGHALPLALGGYVFWRGASTNRVLQVRTIALTSVCVLVGGFVFRYVLVLGGQVSLPVPTLS